MNSDLAIPMSSLSLQSSSLEQQRHAEAQNPQYGTSAHVEEPLAAPTPTRASIGPHTGMWTPEVGIKFGTAPGKPRPVNGPPQDGRWDPAKGLKFG